MARMPNPSPIRRVPLAFSLDEKRPGLEAVHPVSSGATVEMSGATPLLIQNAGRICSFIRHRDNLYLYTQNDIQALNIKKRSTEFSQRMYKEWRDGAVFLVERAWPRTQHDCHHDTKVKPKAATAVIELLMMGGKTPETCWAVNKLKNCCIRLVIYLNCTMMHGLTNLKFYI